MFLAKKILGTLLQPLPFSVVISAFGIYLILFSKRRRLGKFCLVLAFLIAIVFSTPIVGNSLIRSLEQQYPAVIDISPYRTLRYIVVLSGGHAVDETTPLSNHLSSSSLKRLMEGLRLKQQLPGATLVISGGAVFSKHREGDSMTALIKALGLGNENIVIENGSRDTASQALAISKLTGQQPFLLVTSAAHMPRSMLLMQRQGLNPVAAPTDFRATKTNWRDPSDLLPGSSHLKKSESAIHEYLGKWWAYLSA